MNEFVLRSITWFFIGLIVLGSLFFLPPVIFSGTLVFILAYILCIEWPRLAKKNKSLWLLTPIYPVAPFLIMLYFNNHEQYRYLLQLLFITAFCNDTGAYLVGKHFGIHPILPNISPKKTWEGFGGGYLFVLIAFFSIQYVTKTQTSWLNLALLGLLCSCIATVGDFFESWLKRRAHIKDSGGLLPGHGGLLDRFDSSLFLAILFFFIKSTFR